MALQSRIEIRTPLDLLWDDVIFKKSQNEEALVGAFINSWYITTWLLRCFLVADFR